MYESKSKAERGGDRASEHEDAKIAARSRATGLAPGVLAGMEGLLGQTLTDVRVHPDSPLPTRLGARAMARGRDVYVAPQKFVPDTPAGLRLLGHEFAHVVQQDQGRVQANGSVRGVPVNDDPHLEREADALGAKAAHLAGRRQGQPQRTGTAPASGERQDPAAGPAAGPA